MRDAANSKSWFYLDSGSCEPAFNMAMDEALLLLAAEVDHPVIRFYSWTEPAATFGYSQHIAEIEALTHLRPLVRRCTGGGLVPHDADWTYSVAVPPSDAWYQIHAAESYRLMHEWLRSAFACLGVDTKVAPCCRKVAPGQCFLGYEKFDLLWLGRKIAGAAQRRTKTGLLIQGSVQPQPPGVERSAWQQALRHVAGQERGVAWSEYPAMDSLMPLTRQLSAEKYSLDAHNRRR